MNLMLTRKNYTKNSVTGELFVDGKFTCYTLERPRADFKDAIAPFCVPAGVYDVKITWFPHFNRNAPLLQDVPGRTGIFIHPGNFPKDTLGCILVGNTVSVDYVGDSRITFENLMRVLQGASSEINISIA